MLAVDALALAGLAELLERVPPGRVEQAIALARAAESRRTSDLSTSDEITSSTSHDSIVSSAQISLAASIVQPPAKTDAAVDECVRSRSLSRL